MQAKLDVCIREGGGFALDKLNATVAESTVQLSVAEEQAANALLACQQQFLDDDCSQRRLQRLGTSLDSLVAVYTKKVSSQTRNASEEDVSMRNLAAMHGKVQVLGNARKAVQVVHNWKNAINTGKALRKKAIAHFEEGAQHVRTVWESLQIATAHRDELEQLGLESASSSTCLANMDGQLADALDGCLEACSDLVARCAHRAPSDFLHSMVQLAPAPHRRAVVRATAAQFANALPSEAAGMTAVDAFRSLDPELLGADARYWAVVACVAPRGILGPTRPPARPWQQALASAAQAVDQHSGMACGTARQLLLAALGDGGVSLPSASSKPAVAPLLPQAQDALARALRQDGGSSDALGALSELQSIMVDYLSRFQHAVAHAGAVAAQLPPAPQATAAALQDAAVVAAVHCIAPVLGMVRVQWLGACVLAAAAGLGGEGGGEDQAPAAAALQALCPLAHFVHGGKLQLWVETAAVFGIDCRISAQAVQEQLQARVLACTAQLRSAATTAARSRVESDATDVFADEDDAVVHGGGTSTASGDSVPCRVLRALLLGTAADALASALEDAVETRSRGHTAEGADVDSLLQHMLASSAPAPVADSGSGGQGGQASDAAALAAASAAAHGEQLRQVLAAMAREIAQGGDASCAPAAFSPRFSTPLSTHCRSLLVGAVDALLAPALGALTPLPHEAPSVDSTHSMYSLQPSAAIVEACSALMGTLQQCSPDALAPALGTGGHSRPPQATLGECLRFVQAAHAAMWQGAGRSATQVPQPPSSPPPVLARVLGMVRSQQEGGSTSTQEEAAAFAALLVFCCGERMQAHILSWMGGGGLSAAQREVDAEHVESFMESVGLHADVEVLQGTVREESQPLA